MARKTKELPGIIVDADDMASKSSRRIRTSQVEESFNPEWKCQYCGKTLANEAFYMRHHCREKERALEIQTPEGQAAYMFYCDWMKFFKRKAPSIETFTTSRYYSSFVEFARHVKKLNISEPSKFVEILCVKEISPMLWRRDQCYTMYLEWVDKKQDPLEQVKSSIETLIDLAEREDIAELSSIFEHLGVRRIVELIRLRKLSPWFLLCSTKFSAYLRSIPQEDSNEVSAVINPTYWINKLQEKGSVVKEIVLINKEMGL